MKKYLLISFLLLSLSGCVGQLDNDEKNSAKNSPVSLTKKQSSGTQKKQTPKNDFKIVNKENGHKSVTLEIPDSDLTLISPDFQDGAPLPAKFSCDGTGEFPTLKISQIPTGTKSLLLIMSSPRGSLPKIVHGTFWDIPADTKEITSQKIREFSQGINDFETKEYVAPCPDPGKSEDYLFEVWALDKEISHDNSDWTAGHLLVNSLGHVLGKAVLKTSYSR